MHGYTVAFAISAVLFGVGALAAVLLLPSRRRLEELRNAALAGRKASAGQCRARGQPVRARVTRR